MADDNIQAMDLTKTSDDDDVAIKELYESLDIDINNRSNRLNSIHMRGVSEMSPDDIAQYFTDLKFQSIEWINDNSCNVIWENEIMAAKAILSKYKSVIKQVVRRNSNDLQDENITSEDEKMQIVNGEDKNDDEVTKLGIPVPPGHWVVGSPFEKSIGILMRFALKSDKKIPGAEKHSQYYRKHGNPNYGGMVGLISKSKKRLYREIFFDTQSIKKEEPEITNTDNVFESEIGIVNKIPKMKMYADEETQKKKLKQSVDEHIFVGDLRNKLSSKSSTIYSYKSNDEEEIPIETDLRSKLKQRANSRSNENDFDTVELDLRKKLNQMRRRKQQNLIIEVDQV